MTCNYNTDVSKHNPNPIHQHSNGKWYFCDEAWSDCYGPFETEEEAQIACKEYAEKYL